MSMAGMAPRSLKTTAMPRTARVIPLRSWNTTPPASTAGLVALAGLCLLAWVPIFAVALLAGAALSTLFGALVGAWGALIAIGVGLELRRR